MLRQIWTDPVWSKVIANAIWSGGGAVVYFGGVWSYIIAIASEIGPIAASSTPVSNLFLVPICLLAAFGMFNLLAALYPQPSTPSQIATAIPTELLSNWERVKKPAERFSEIQRVTAGDYYDFKYADSKVRIKIKEIRKEALRNPKDRIINNEPGDKEVFVAVVSFPEGLGIIGALPYCGPSAKWSDGDFLLQEAWHAFPLAYSVYTIEYLDFGDNRGGSFTFLRIYVENINMNTSQVQLNLLAIQGRL